MSPTKENGDRTRPSIEPIPDTPENVARAILRTPPDPKKAKPDDEGDE